MGGVVSCKQVRPAVKLARPGGLLLWALVKLLKFLNGLKGGQVVAGGCCEVKRGCQTVGKRGCGLWVVVGLA